MSSNKSSSFISDVLKLVFGTTFAQVLTILASPVLTRLYGPEAFGVLALFMSIVGIIGVIACLGYEYAIMLPKTDEEATNLLGLSLLNVAGVSCFTVPLVYFGGGAIMDILQAPNLESYLILVPPFIFTSGIFLALNYWNSRTKHFGRLSFARVAQSVTSTGTQLGVGFAGYTNGGGLIGGIFIGSLVSTMILGGQILRDDFLLLHQNISWKGMLKGLIRYKKFLFIDTSSNLLNTISWQLPMFLLAVFFSPVVVGFYALGWRLLQLPMGLIGSSITQVFYQRASEAEHKGDLEPIVKGVFQTLLKVGLFPMLVVTLVGKEIFQFVFGNLWAEAGVYTQILSIWAIIWFISSPLSIIYLIKERQEFGLKISITNLSTRFTSLIIGGLLGSPIIALLLFSITGIMTYGYLVLALLQMSGVAPVWAIKKSLSIGKLFIPSGIILLILKQSNASDAIIFIMSSSLILIYYYYIIKTDPYVKQIVAKKWLR